MRLNDNKMLMSRLGFYAPSIIFLYIYDGTAWFDPWTHVRFRSYNPTTSFISLFFFLLSRYDKGCVVMKKK